MEYILVTDSIKEAVLTKVVNKINQEASKENSDHIPVTNNEYIQSIFSRAIASWKQAQDMEEAQKNYERLKSLPAETQAYLLNLLEQEANGNE